jgi:hypothetical protein
LLAAILSRDAVSALKMGTNYPARAPLRPAHDLAVRDEEPGVLAGSRLGRFTLVDAAHQVTALHPATNLFAPALSLVVLLAWPAVALLAAALMITRRDA